MLYSVILLYIISPINPSEPSDKQTQQGGPRSFAAIDFSGHRWNALTSGSVTVAPSRFLVRTGFSQGKTDGADEGWELERFQNSLDEKKATPEGKSHILTKMTHNYLAFDDHIWEGESIYCINEPCNLPTSEVVESPWSTCRMLPLRAQKSRVRRPGFCDTFALGTKAACTLEA